MSHSNCVKSVVLWSAAARYRSALTLLELVVVLGILALLSTVAVRSLEPIADQTRYEATQRTLNDLRFALVGDSVHRTMSGSSVISGFVADTGALPSSVDDLLNQPGGLAVHAVAVFDSDRDAVNDVSLSGGWKGPYLQLGAGQSEVLDGWGRAPSLVVNGSELALISQGSDGDSLASEDGYRADMTLNVESENYSGDIVFRLFEIDGVTGSRIDPGPTGTEQLGVLFYGINAASGGTGAIEEQMLVVAPVGSFEFRRSDTIHGTVAARAILWDDADSDDVLDPSETITKKSYVHYSVVNSAAECRVEMELR